MRTKTSVMIAMLTTASNSAVWAQSDLRIYGRINTSIERQTVGGNSVTAMVNNNSRIGFLGSESLGQGMKAGFALEAGFQSDTGAGMLADGGMSFKRNSNVYLAGNFGQLSMGMTGGRSYDFVADYGVLDQPNHDTGAVSDALYHIVTRGSNGIAYTSPTVNGLTVVSAVSLHERDPDSTQKNSYDLAANWALGAWSLAAGYSHHGDSSQWGLRAHYTAGPFQIAAYFQRATDALGLACNNGGAACGQRNNARVSAMYTAGAAQFVVGYGATGQWDQVADSSARQLMLGCNYNLSRRTKVYALYTKLDNSANVKYGYGFKNGVAFGQDARTMGVGLRHEF
ncbi:porin [Comamonas sp. GB3 AK4-5]|uniref:porin n=1 Tax=Comamonas sp. GB3 AK4-5 TaxID=3231487 RepID=UPI00351DDDA6